MEDKIAELISQKRVIANKIADLKSTIQEELSLMEGEFNALQIKLDEALYKESLRELKDKPYGCGTVNIDLGTHKAKVVVSKKVKWDEDKLRSIASQIRDSGQDPEVYIKYKLSVTEAAYKGFPENIQDAFLPARTVEASKPEITLEEK